MKIGALIFPTDKGIQPAELARDLEARGYDTLWMPEHSHIPVSRATPWGGRDGAPPLPEEYWRTHDQFLALATAAAVTTKLRVGTGITLVAQRDPIWLAKEVATLDHLSGGRALLGVGYGWNIEEMENHGIDTSRRRALVREKLLACRELWTKDEASYDGEFVKFDASWSWPKPLQKPYPPIVFGAAASPVTLRHLIEFGDAWMPIEGRWPIAESWQKVLQTAADSGRDPATLSLGIYGAKPNIAHLEMLQEGGASFAALGLPALDRDAALAKLDELQPIVDHFASQS
jgi:probable F420-dependent oxidoreductase